MKHVTPRRLRPEHAGARWTTRRAIALAKIRRGLPSYEPLPLRGSLGIANVQAAEWQQDWMERVANEIKWAGATAELPPGLRVTANTAPLDLGGRTGG